MAGTGLTHRRTALALWVDPTPPPLLTWRTPRLMIRTTGEELA